MRVARSAGASVLVVTGQPDGACARDADLVISLRARTMANGSEAESGAETVLPIGSVYEGALFILFECLVVAVREKLGIAVSAMRSRHTNLE